MSRGIKGLVAIGFAAAMLPSSTTPKMNWWWYERQRRVGSEKKQANLQSCLDCIDDGWRQPEGDSGPQADPGRAAGTPDPGVPDTRG